MITEYTPISIAVADDHRLIREGILNTLQLIYPKDFVLHFEVENGGKLIEKLTQVDKLPDIILLDISMPVMNGYEAMSIIRTKWPDQKVIAMSMYRDKYAIVKMIYNGANGFITKDISPDEIYMALTTTHITGTYFQGQYSKFSSKTIHELKTRIPNITDKQMKFLALCPTKMHYNEIAQELGLSIRTIHSYRDTLFRKFDVNTRIELALFAIRIGLQPNIDTLQS